MANFNNVVLLGNLVADPELKEIGESKVTKFRLAVNRKYTTKGGEKRDDTLYVDCEMWGPRGEALKKYTKKGEPILVHGFLKQESWQNKDGENRSKILVSIQDFEFISTRSTKSETSSGEPSETVALSSEDIPF